MQASNVIKIHEYPLKRPLFMSNEMEELKRHFFKMEDCLEKLDTKIGLMEHSITEVKGAVIGNPPMGQKGLAQRMEDIEDRMMEYDKKGVLSSTEKVHILEDRIRAYDKMLDRGWGAGKIIVVIWTLVGGFIGSMIMLVLKNLQLIKF